MIRISLNLARRPADNLRRIWIIWGGALAALLALLLVLATVALVGWVRSRQVQAQVDAVHAEITPLEANTQAIEAPLAQPAIRAALDQAAFLNQLLDRKSVSWTRLFERLETIMPAQVELVSLRPLDRNGVSAIDLRFASDDLEPAIDFVNALETSRDFADAKVERETGNTSNNDAAGGRGAAQEKAPRYLIEATAEYRPDPAGAADADAHAHAHGDSDGDVGAAPDADQPAKPPVAKPPIAKPPAAKPPLAPAAKPKPATPRQETQPQETPR